MKLTFFKQPALATVGILLGITLHAAEIIPSDKASHVMDAFPAPRERLVQRFNHVEAGNLRWSLSHMRMLVPTANIRAGSAPISVLPTAVSSILEGGFEGTDGNQISYQQWLRQTNTDALLILHDGAVVFEGYADDVPLNTPHTLQSVSKSFIGLLAAMLIHDELLDPEAPVARYVPELSDSAWGNATVQQTLDMTASVRFSEDITDPDSDVMRYYGIASGSFPPPEDYRGPEHIYAMLEILPQDGHHGEGFIYKSVHPEAIAWAISRITGKRPSTLISERIWTKLGAEEDAYVTLDPVGTEMMGGGMSAGLRDLARFAEMLRRDGYFNGEQIIAPEVVAEIFKGGDPEKFKVDPQRRDMVGYSYHNFWWKPPGDDNIIEANGGFGQKIHINKTAGTVIVKFASNTLGQEYNVSKVLDRAAFAALDRKLASLR